PEADSTAHAHGARPRIARSRPGSASPRRSASRLSTSRTPFGEELWLAYPWSDRSHEVGKGRTSLPSPHLSDPREVRSFGPTASSRFDVRWNRQESRTRTRSRHAQSARTDL